MVLGSKKYDGMARRLAVIFSVTGALFCVLAAFGWAERICVTSGCDLYSDWTLLGLSLWWWGAGGFALLAATSLAMPAAALVLASVGLAADAVLLTIMAFMAPCGNCLIAGSGFLLVWLCLRKAGGERSLAGTVLTVVWLMALTPNLLGLASDGPGWAVYGPENARMYIYFSPSCPHCRRAVMDLAANLPGDVAYIPVSENSTDVERIIALHKAVENGVPFRTAFPTSILAGLLKQETGLVERIVYQIRIARNHAIFRRMGGTSVPVVVMAGWGGASFQEGPPPAPGEPRDQHAPAPAPAPAPEAPPAPEPAPAPAPQG